MKNIVASGLTNFKGMLKTVIKVVELPKDF